MDQNTKLGVATILATSVAVGTLATCFSKSILPPLSTFLTSLRSSSIGGNGSCDVDKALEELKAFFPADQLGTDEKTLNEFGTSWGSIGTTTPPTLVVYVLNTTEVVKVVSIASKYKIIIIPVGGRTSLEGQFSCCNPSSNSSFSSGSTSGRGSASTLVMRPTIHISLERMNKVIKVYPADQQAIVECGVGWQSLNKHLEVSLCPFFPSLSYSSSKSCH